jgi:transcriptional regulator with XRE-family HTH domain
MARAALGWSADELADVIGVERKTIIRFERGASNPRDTNMDAIRNALEAAGVRFIDSGPDAGAVVPPL